MGSGQSNALKGKTVEEQAILVENRSEEEALAETEETKKSISLDWHHPTRAMEDHFTLLSKKPIGRGHFADVFLGQAINSGRKGLNLEVGQLVAVKHVYRSRCSEDNLHKEVDALLEIATRHHPNIVALLDAFLTSDKLILVLEYCPGGELFEHLAGEGPYSEQAASEMVKQMAHVLHFLHSHNCTHRDLKPENVLLMNTDDDHGMPLIKVADFGLATMKKEPFMTSVCGTWAYCAPEVRNDRVYTKSVDVWSLGVITFILVAGFHPFDPSGDATEKELEKNISEGKFDFDDPEFDGISEACKDIIVRMLVVEPSLRITVDQILKHSWITHESPSEPLITAPNKLKPLVEHFGRRRKELGTVMHLMALSRMEHLALHHGLLTDEHLDEVHSLHHEHTAESLALSRKEAKELAAGSESPTVTTVKSKRSLRKLESVTSVEADGEATAKSE
eukprot:INCI10194.1.p1 GENE.INCI10194.1~~INCI10194.1.p1  ORF type:complete len:449 (-),score=68.36 INCI10194.1:215-1561(-)